MREPVQFRPLTTYTEREMDDVDREVRKLKEALEVSEWHFKDAVQDLMERCGYGREEDEWEY